MFPLWRDSMQVAFEKEQVPANGSEVLAEEALVGGVVRTPEELASIVEAFAAGDRWMERVRLRTDRRWYERVHCGVDHDVWVISWMPGQSTGFHDHGASSGAFVVASGTLEEHRAGEGTSEIPTCGIRAFGPHYTHDVRNTSVAPAISIHAYSPPLDEMNEYELEGSELVPRERGLVEADRLDLEWRVERRKPMERAGGLSVEQMLAAARARLGRLSADEVHAAMENGDSVVVDIRPEAQRAIEGEIAGALIVERNVLEWRFDPMSTARLPVATDHGVQVIVFCSEGYTSSLAAASLQDLGLWRATDMVGGFRAWRRAGLPVLLPGNAS
jgi:rhodanese-related sulfurtransferase